eukprot:PITA_13943
MVWKLYFDGANSKEENGATVLLVSPKGNLIPLSCNLECEATNNVAEYEVLLLGLQAIKNLNIRCLKVIEDSKLVVKEIRNQCQTKHPRLKDYKNEVWDLIENIFLAFNIQFMHNEHNRMENSLVIDVRNFKPPQNPLLRYEVEFYWKDPVRILLLCLVEEEISKEIDEFHNFVCGGHYSWRATTHKILKFGFYWPKILSEVHKYVRACEKCQIFTEKQKLVPLPLIHDFVEEPFRKWGIGFIGEIHPPSSGQQKWILTTTYYYMKWVEAIETRNANDAVVIKFMEENILVQFGCPKNIITDSTQVFKSAKFLSFCQKYNIIVGHSTNYYP